MFEVNQSATATSTARVSRRQCPLVRRRARSVYRPRPSPRRRRRRIEFGPQIARRRGKLWARAIGADDQNQYGARPSGRAAAGRPGGHLGVRSVGRLVLRLPAIVLARSPPRSVRHRRDLAGSCSSDRVRAGQHRAAARAAGTSNSRRAARGRERTGQSAARPRVRSRMSRLITQTTRHL